MRGRPKGSGTLKTGDKIAIEGKGLILSDEATSPTDSGNQALNFASQDGWLYHVDIEPRFFKKGEEVPVGFTGPAGILGTIWQQEPTGKWRKVK